MHICFITHEYPLPGRKPGGIGVFVKTLGNALADAGHRVSVIGGKSNGGYKKHVDAGMTIYDIPTAKIPGVKWLQNRHYLVKLIRNIHRETPIDILEGAESAFAYLPAFTNIKKVIRLHGGHCFFTASANGTLNWRKRINEQRSLNRCDGIIGITQYVLDQTAQYLTIKKVKTALITHPIDTTFFSPDPSIEEKNLHLTFAGTICKKKGIFELCQAIRILKEDFPDITLDVLGKDSFLPNGNSYTAFLQKAFFPELSSNIFFHGPVSQVELKKYYAQAHLCVFPSHMETQGLIAPEAMAMKKLVIFSSTGPGPETIEHKKTGLLCNPHDPADIAKQIRWALENQKAITQIKQAGYEFVQKKFNIDEAVKKNIAFYASL